jgi:hypothetical protein
VAATATPISATTEQQYDDENDQDQFHWNLPLTQTAGFTARQRINGALALLFPTLAQVSADRRFSDVSNQAHPAVLARRPSIG